MFVHYNHKPIIYILFPEIILIAYEAIYVEIDIYIHYYNEY
jgi:hypothetical protein